MDTGIFKYIWRLNAILFLIFAVIILVMSINELNDNRARKAKHRAVAQNRANRSVARMPAPYQIGNTPYFVFVLGQGDDSWMIGNAPTWITENLLFVDGRTNERRWLYEGDGPLIQLWEPIEVIDSSGEVAAIAGIFYHTLETDSGGDGELESGEGGSMMVSAVDGSDLQLIVEGPVFEPEIRVVGERLFCTYRTEDGAGSAVFELDGSFNCVSRAALPLSPDAVPTK